MIELGIEPNIEPIKMIKQLLTWSPCQVDAAYCLTSTATGSPCVSRWRVGRWAQGASSWWFLTMGAAFFWNDHTYLGIPGSKKELNNASMFVIDICQLKILKSELPQKIELCRRIRRIRLEILTLGMPWFHDISCKSCRFHPPVFGDIQSFTAYKYVQYI